MTFKYELNETVTCTTTNPVTTGTVHARTEYAGSNTQPAYQIHWRDQLGRLNSVWFNESLLSAVGSVSSPPQ